MPEELPARPDDQERPALSRTRRLSVAHERDEIGSMQNYFGGKKEGFIGPSVMALAYSPYSMDRVAIQYLL